MTIFRKSFVTLGLTTLGLSAALVVLVLVFMNSLYYEANAAGLIDSARTVAAVAGNRALADYFKAAAGSEQVLPPEGIRTLPQDNSQRITLIDKKGEVLWDSLVEGDLVNHLDREEIQAALEGRVGSSWRDSKSSGVRQIYAALPVYAEDGGIAGIFRLSLTVPVFWRRISAAALPFLLLSCFLIAAAFAEVYAYSVSLSHSIDRLVEIAGLAVIPENITWAVLPGPDESAETDPKEFVVLEQALRGMANELNLRIEAAREEGRRLEAILNGMTEAVFAADGNLILHLINPRAKEMFNLSGKDTQNLSLLEATRSTELEETARAALMENRPLEKELKLHNGAGEQRFQVFAAPLAGEENRDGEGVVLVLQDITQLIRLEQVRKDFVANVSHELRTPIQLMKGFSETLLDLPPDDTKQIRYCVEIIRKNAATMENLVTDLLTLASLENENGVRPAAEEQELAPLFAEAVSSLELQAKKKQIEIIVTCPEGIKAKIYGPYIIQALINLLDNAVKYSPEKSRVWIAARRGNNGAGLVLEVRDEGIGIPAEHLGRIFERFYRVDRAHSRETGGTGLGLSIVRHIALIHNGTAEAESSTGEGSVFRIRLPG